MNGAAERLMNTPRMLVRFGGPLLLIGLALPLIRTQVFSSNDAYDEVNYHRPIIATMATAFPFVDIVNYNAAMAPGYHVVMAAILRASSRLSRFMMPKYLGGSGCPASTMRPNSASSFTPKAQLNRRS